MSDPISLKELEKKAFVKSFDDGLWDILLGCVFLMFAIAPLLSATLGDFWSSAIFLPFWAAVYLLIRLIRKHVVEPRLGVVKFGRSRKRRLARFTILMLTFNFLALILGIVIAANARSVPGLLYTAIFAVLCISSFSLAAYFLDFNRLYLYGLLTGISPLVGEWLWRKGIAVHHGFPLTFALTSGVMLLAGTAIFLRFLRENPLPPQGMQLENG